MWKKSVRTESVCGISRPCPQPLGSTAVALCRSKPAFIGLPASPGNGNALHIKPFHFMPALGAEPVSDIVCHYGIS
jgi:hypothetical protein